MKSQAGVGNLLIVVGLLTFSIIIAYRGLHLIIVFMGLKSLSGQQSKVAIDGLHKFKDLFWGLRTGLGSTSPCSFV